MSHMFLHYILQHVRKHNMKTERQEEDPLFVAAVQKLTIQCLTVQSRLEFFELNTYSHYQFEGIFVHAHRRLVLLHHFKNTYLH